MLLVDTLIVIIFYFIFIIEMDSHASLLNFLPSMLHLVLACFILQKEKEGASPRGIFVGHMNTISYGRNADLGLSK